jgi:hypothetical protein
MRSRVIPGSSVTIERRVPVSRLKIVDFPTFGRPTITTDGSFSVIGRHNEPQVRGSEASTVPYSTLKQKLGKFPLVMCIFRQMPKWGHKQFDQLA